MSNSSSPLHPAATNEISASLQAFGKSVNKSDYYPVVTHSFSEEDVPSWSSISVSMLTIFVPEWNLTKEDLIARFEASRQDGIEASGLEEIWLAKRNREREERLAHYQQWSKNAAAGLKS